MIAMGALACAFSAAASDYQWIVPADEWARPRDGARVVSLAPLRDSAVEWMREPDQRLVIRYPGGEEGVLWAGELRDWLVALGIPSARVELVPGYPRADAMEITVSPPGAF
ncbi:MAG: hypothetical protein GWN54_12820 [Gammaproteobacteria bacterium]|nr:hypothetical protein [Gammaproteobacteria bacterium]